MTDEQRPNNGDDDLENGKRPDFPGLGVWTAEGAGAQLVIAYSRGGFSQRTFADALGFSAKQLSRWVDADPAPGPERRARILEVLGGPTAPLWRDPPFRALADALGVPRRPWWRHPALLAATAALVVAGGGLGLWAWRTRQAPDPVVAVEPSTQGPWVFRYASGRTLAVPMQARNGCFAWPTPPAPVTHVGTLDRRGRLAAVVVSIDTDRPDSRTGQVRADFFDRRGHVVRTAWLDEHPVYADTLANNVWSLAHVQFLDWDGDARTIETLLVATHTLFPSVLTIISAEGMRGPTYAHAGHIRDVVAVPADFGAPAEVTQASVVGPRPARGVALVLSVEYNDAPRSAGLVVLPAAFPSGACPTTSPPFRHAVWPALAQARYVRTLPSLCAQRCPAAHNWPEHVHYDADTRTVQLTTLEEPGNRVNPADGIIRYIDGALRQKQVIPTDRFRHEYPTLQALYGLPPLDSEPFAASIEARAEWTGGTWQALRDSGAWHP